MNREELAEHLASVFLQSSVKWPEIGAHAQAMWLAVADAALSALKGPRTGEELYAALSAACEATGALRHARLWRNADPNWHDAYNTVAATFSAPPEPEGWPGGWSIANASAVSAAGEWRIAITDGHSLRAWVDGKTKDEARELARLTAWTIANQRPVAKLAGALDILSPSLAEAAAGIGRAAAEMGLRAAYEDLKRDHAALLAAVNGPGGYREQVDARPCLASHLTPTVRRSVRPGLLEILTSTGSCSPAEVDEALDDADKMAALLLRVRAVGEF